MSQKINLPSFPKKKVKRSKSRKVLTLLILFFIIVLFVLFFNSSFSRIQSIEIQGNYYLTEEEIGQALDVKMGDQFFTVSSKKLEQRVKTLGIVQSVVVKKHFPGEISVEVSEYPEVAYQINGGQPEVILANGSEMEPKTQTTMFDKPILTGWSQDSLVKQELIQALASIPRTLLIDISEIIPFEPTNAYPDKIKLYTRSFFEVVTTVEYLPEQIKYLGGVIADQNSKGNTTGVITMLEVITHAPFEMEETPVEDE